MESESTELEAAILYWKLSHPQFNTPTQLQQLWEFEWWLLERKEIKTSKPVNYIEQELLDYIQKQRYKSLKHLQRTLTVAVHCIPYYSKQTQECLLKWTQDCNTLVTLAV